MRLSGKFFPSLALAGPAVSSIPRCSTSLLRVFSYLFVLGISPIACKAPDESRSSATSKRGSGQPESHSGPPQEGGGVRGKRDQEVTSDDTLGSLKGIDREQGDSSVLTPAWLSDEEIKVLLQACQSNSDPAGVVRAVVVMCTQLRESDSLDDSKLRDTKGGDARRDADCSLKGSDALILDQNHSISSRHKVTGWAHVCVEGRVGYMRLDELAVVTK